MIDESSDLPELTPLQQILFDLETERILEELPTELPQSEEEAQQAKRELNSVFQHLREIASSSDEHPVVSPASPIQLSRSVDIEPFATLAAAESVVATIAWEGGHFRLLQSSMRSDLAIEVLVDPGFLEAYLDTVLLVAYGESDQVLAIFPNESAVFSGSLAQDLANGASLSYEILLVSEIDKQHLPILQTSKENLLSPRSLKRYRELIKQVESES